MPKLLALLAALLVMSAIPVSAEDLPPSCKPSFDELAADLKQRFQEEPAGIGTSEKTGFADVLFIGPKGTWTLASVLPNGAACLFEGGHGWRQAKRPGEPA